jgi:hypothetical protein
MNGDPLKIIHEEWEQMEIRRKNIVVHGLKEATDEQDDAGQIGYLLEEISQGLTPFQAYRTGPKNSSRPRAIVIKFETTELRDTYLANAINLKGKEKLKKVILAPNLMKKQREWNKAKEASLKLETERKNIELSEDQKNESPWIVIGRGGSRHVARKRPA